MGAVLMLVALLLPFGEIQKPPFAKEVPLLKKLADRVQKDGQESPPELLVDKFLDLKGKSVRWHAPYDSERQVQLYRHAEVKPERLIFILPEKPFPEFGKVWVYSVSLEGKLLKAGVSELREPFKNIEDKKQAEADCRKEIEHWLDYFKIKNP